ncbi:MAG: MarC family protein [Alphaproteobacteria bacterium]|nr:MarC family protein [Alphaproteobacteria bacterium]
MLETFLSSFVSLLVIVDPIGTAAVFIALTTRLTHIEKRRVAYKAVTIAITLLIVFGLAGKTILHHMGISMDAFRIAGGLLLFVTAFRMIMGSSTADHMDEEKAAKTYHHSDIVVFPLSIPLLAGPGCMTASVLHMSNADTLALKGVVIGSIIIVELLALGCLLGATAMTKIMGKTGTSLLSRLMGVLLAALSVQFVVDGTLNMMAMKLQ